MNVVYVLLSPTLGMHQYTADLADRAAVDGHEVHLVTTARLPRDRYGEGVRIHTPLDTRTRGFSREALRLSAIRRVQQAILDLHPDLVHFTGPHLWNVPLVRGLSRRGVPLLHTLHDLDPHHGSGYGRLLYAWNALILRYATHILVHGVRFRARLIQSGLPAGRVTYTPLLHLFLGNAVLEPDSGLDCEVTYEPWALFFGRLVPYKGVEYLITACAMMNGQNQPGPRVVVAGPGDLNGLWAGPLPARLELRNHLVGDREALDLFRRCGLVVLPYVEASQSALVAAAYYFRKPVLVTRTGALPEYVVEGSTGCVVEPAHATGLARTLDRMLADKAGLMRMGMAGRAWYEARRCEETAALSKLYRELAEHK